MGARGRVARRRRASIREARPSTWRSTNTNAQLGNGATQRCCYNVVRKNDPDARGEITVRFTIDATGSVGTAETVATSMESDTLAPCVARTVKRWKFPKGDDPSESVVTCPFAFEVR